MNKLKYFVALAALTIGATAMAADKGASSDTTLIDALVKKGVLTEDEAKEILQKNKSERRDLITSIADAGRKEEKKPLWSFHGKIRTFMEHDDIDTPTVQPDAKVSNWISKVGAKFQLPITTVDFMDGWVVNGRYETQFQSDNPKGANTYAGDVWSTIGLASSDENEKFRIDWGRKAHGLWINFLEFGIFGDDAASPLGEIHARQNIYMSNGIFTQIRPWKGGRINLDYQLSERDGVDNPYSLTVRHDWERVTLSATRYDANNGNTSNMLAGAIKFPELKSRLSGMISSDEQTSASGNPWPTGGLKTKGYSAQWAWSGIENNTVLVGGGYRDDGVKVLALGDDYKLNDNLTLQVHYQHVDASDPIVFTTANDIGPLFGTNGGGPAGTATSRDHLAVGLKFVF